ncbi:hypothetical protein EVAR_52294_1 [Eumeta japonica]|uniref:Uncharacterized protein n=1 Tax=Eumeta variegata TaxID=151549 RepID=A0A4C1Y757_EUMVA|nr:hypothetical protein EVAR_52294_1 [Eumeta japonica]
MEQHTAVPSESYVGGRAPAEFIFFNHCRTSSGAVSRALPGGGARAASLRVDNSRGRADERTQRTARGSPPSFYWSINNPGRGVPALLSMRILFKVAFYAARARARAPFCALCPRRVRRPKESKRRS